LYSTYNQSASRSETATDTKKDDMRSDSRRVEAVTNEETDTVAVRASLLARTMLLRTPKTAYRNQMANDGIRKTATEATIQTQTDAAAKANGDIHEAVSTNQDIVVEQSVFGVYPLNRSSRGFDGS